SPVTGAIASTVPALAIPPNLSVPSRATWPAASVIADRACPMAAWARTCRWEATVSAVQLMYHWAKTWTACTGERQPPRASWAGAGVGISWVRCARATVARIRDGTLPADGRGARLSGMVVVCAVAVASAARAAAGAPAARVVEERPSGPDPPKGRPQSASNAAAVIAASAAAVAARAPRTRPRAIYSPTGWRTT